MRAIHVADLDKHRPVVLLTRELVIQHLDQVTVAPVTTVIRGLSTEVPVGPENGLEAQAVVSCDNITTIPKELLGEPVGHILPRQERSLALAIQMAFDLGRA